MEVVLSGDFNRYSREEVTNLLQAAGNRVSGSISKKTSIMFAGENCKEIKRQDAELQGVPVVAGSVLLDLIRSGHLTHERLETLSLRQTINKDQENRKPTSPQPKNIGQRENLTFSLNPFPCELTERTKSNMFGRIPHRLIWRTAIPTRVRQILRPPLPRRRS